MISGLADSRAVDNALIIAIEPLMTSLMAWVILKDRLRAVDWLGFSIALIGFSLLSGLTPERVMWGLDRHLVGNLLILVSLAGEALYSPLSKILMREARPILVFRSALFLGVAVLSALVFLVLRAPGPQSLAWSAREVGALLWLGPLGTACTYFFWTWALTRATIAQMAVTLFVQPLAGALFGYLILGETLSWVQGLGGVLIVLAVLVPSLKK